MPEKSSLHQSPPMSIFLHFSFSDLKNCLNVGTRYPWIMDTETTADYSALLAQPAKTGFVRAAVFCYDDQGEPSSVLTTDVLDAA